MNGQDQQPQQPAADGKVPMKDRVSGGYFRVPKDDVYNMSHYHHGETVSEDEYNAAVARQRKKTAPSGAPPAAPPPSAAPAAPQKPSAALGPTGQPVTIPAPGGAGTNTVTGPRAAPAPPPVSGAGAGAPPPELPPGGVQSATPVGRQQQTQQQQAAPTAGVLSDVASGLGKTIEQQAARTGAAFGVIAPSTAQRIASQPMSDVEQATRDTTEFMEWMAIPMGHGAIDEGTAALVKRFVPQITSKGVVSAQVLARILYNTALGAELGKAQGKDPKTAAIINGGLSLLLEPLAKLSPMMLAKFLGAETERSGSLPAVGRKAMEAAKYRLVGTRYQFANRAETMYNQAVAETDRLSQQAMAPGTQRQASTSIRSMILDIQKTIDNGPVNQRGKLMKLQKELISSSSTADRSKIQATLKEWRTQQANYLKNQRAMQGATPAMRPVYMEAMSVAAEKSTRLRQELQNIPAIITSDDLNQLRRTLADMSPWGKRDIEMSLSDKTTRDTYNKIAALQKQLVPGSARSIGDEDALHDLAMGASKNLGLTGYIHSLSSPASLATSGATLIGYHLGGPTLPGKVAGAVAGGMTGVPAMTAGMRALNSRLARGAMYGTAQQLLNEDQNTGTVPTGDFSTKGKASPYTME